MRQLVTIAAAIAIMALAACTGPQGPSGPPDRRVRRGRPVAKAQLDPPANADHQGLRARLAHPVPPDQRGRRVTPALHRQFAWSLERIAFTAETMKSWLALFARAARPTEPSARRLPRQQPGYVYVADLVHDFLVTSL
jgi:hypothetical protein